MSGRLRWTAWLAVGALVVMLAACTGSAQEVQLDEGANGTAVTLAQGQTLVVELVSNPTTGYSWEVAQVDSSVLLQEGDAEYTPEDTSSELVGSGGRETLRFTAVAPGQTTLTLIYQRPFEEDVPPAETFSVQVTVE